MPRASEAAQAVSATAGSAHVVIEETGSAAVAVALDVGGTTTHGALVTDRGALIGSVIAIRSQSDAPRQVILKGLTELVDRVAAAAPPTAKLQAIGVAFPGPFDYAGGISLMDHKFAPIRGLTLADRLAGDTGLDVVFLNDGDAFALGAWWSELKSVSRLVGVTLGTGVGSGFVIHGQIADAGSGAPPDGEIWNIPFGDGIFEDVVSARAIRRSYVQSGGDPSLTVQEIAGRARTGDGSARVAFGALALHLGEGLAAVTSSFTPEHFVFGGQISKAFDLFGDRAAHAFASVIGRRVPWTSTAIAHAALVGAGRYALAGRRTPPSDPGRA